MKQKIKENENKFIIKEEGFPLSLIDEKSIYYLNDFTKIRQEKEIISILDSCDLIIATGIFESIGLLNRLPNKIMKKVLLHFWGADFYVFAQKKSLIHVSWIFMKYKRKKCFQRCAGFIFLINGEYEKFKELTKIEKAHYVAPMPFDPSEKLELSNYRGNQGTTSTIKIQVGNSATETNQHKEIIDWLYNFKDRDMKVYFPLSYGEQKYRQEIMAYGEQRLGKMFIPVVEYMDIHSYAKFLSGMHIGIFNNNRQQAMGNIQMMLAMGKKVYLRDDTSMWKRYIDEGYIVFSIKKALRLQYQEFIKFDKESALNNERIYDENETIEKIKSKWDIIFHKWRDSSYI